MIGWLILAATVVGAGFRIGFESSAPRRVRRRLGRLRETLSGVLRRGEEARTEQEDSLKRAAREYTAAVLQERRQTIPIESLREAGATNVRWSTLRDAGLRTAADLHGWTRGRLEELSGVGPTTADRILAAMGNIDRRLESQPIPLPTPQLSDARSRRIAEAALRVLAVKDAQGSAPTQVRDALEEVNEGIEAISSAWTFHRWLFGSRDGGRGLPEVHEAKDISARVGDLLESDLPGRLQRRGSSESGTGVQGAELESRFRDRFADASALIEWFLPSATVPVERSALRLGAIPETIARRVEAHPLDVSGMRVTLRRYQAFGARYLLAQHRTILGDEMGLGKTIEALAAMVHRSRCDGARYFLVVAPASVTRNWMREIENRTDLSARLLHGGNRSAAAAKWLRDGGVGVTSYETLKTLDLGTQLQRSGTRLDFLVVNEAHYAKNPEAGRSQRVRGLVDLSDHVCLMTGTPMENRPGEFLNLVAIIRADLAPKLRSGSFVLGNVVVDPERFHRTVSEVYLRRNQSEVLRELPPRVDIEEWTDLTAGSEAAYRDAVASGNMMAMRRAVTLSKSEEPSSKFSRLAEILEEHRESGRKVLVYSFFLDVLAEVANRFRPLGVITGSISPPRRMELVDRFQSATGHALLVAQIQAGGVGVNLHAASVVVLMEPQWKPSSEDQAIARAHRMGQTDTVLVHRMLARDTVDERMMAILAGKTELFEAYARESLVKRASEEAMETTWSEAIVSFEQARMTRVG